MTEAQKHAIRDLYNQGWTRANMKKVLNIKDVDIQNVLGKSPRGRKPLSSKPASKKVNKNVTIVDVISIDQSGSMDHVKNEVANGVNNYISDMQKKAKQTGLPSYLGVTTFENPWNASVKKVKTVVPMKEVSAIKNRFSGYAGGGTPLNDGLVESIELAEKFIKKNKLKDVDVTITIFTDGGENSSNTTLSETAAKVKEKKKEGWTIAFVGPHGSQSYASRLDIDTSNVLEYDAADKASHVNTYNKMSASRSAKTDALVANKFSNVNYFVED